MLLDRNAEELKAEKAAAAKILKKTLRRLLRPAFAKKSLDERKKKVLRVQIEAQRIELDALAKAAVELERH